MASKEQLPDFDGVSAFQGALRFLSDGDNALLHEWAIGYQGIAPDIAPFASDSFGVLYGLDSQNQVAIFWPETGEIEQLQTNKEDFLGLILEDPNSTINLDVYLQGIVKLGLLTRSQHFALKIELAVGGKFSVDNLIKMDAKEHMRALGKLARQFKGIPLGTKISNVSLE
jgi:hypothetical protein